MVLESSHARHPKAPSTIRAIHLEAWTQTKNNYRRASIIWKLLLIAWKLLPKETSARTNHSCPWSWWATTSEVLWEFFKSRWTGEALTPNMSETWTSDRYIWSKERISHHDFRIYSSSKCQCLAWVEARFWVMIVTFSKDIIVYYCIY